MVNPQDIQRTIRELYDPLTGIPGPGLFYDRVQQSIHVAEREGLTLAMLLVDLDFTQAAGTSIDDRKLILRTAAHRLTEELRVSDTVGRLEVDQFGIMLPHVYREGLPGVVKRIGASVEQPIRTSQGETFLRAGVGAIVRPDEVNEIEMLMQQVLNALNADHQQQQHGGAAA